MRSRPRSVTRSTSSSPRRIRFRTVFLWTARTWAAYLIHCHHIGHSAATLEGKFYALRAWADHADALDRTPTPDDVLAWLSGQDALSDVSRDTYYRWIRPFWKWAATLSRLPVSPVFVRVTVTTPQNRTEPAHLT